MKERLEDASIKSEVSSEKPNGEVFDFLAQKPHLPKTTTKIDMSSVLSGMSLPRPAKKGGGESTSSERMVDPQAQGNASNQMRNDDEVIKQRGSDARQDNQNHQVTAKVGQLNGTNESEMTRPLHYPMLSNARQKRSSIYESKSTVTAIPVRAASSHNKPNYAEFDDAISIGSASSSLTASFSRSFLFGFYGKHRRGEKAAKGILSRQYWMKDESAKECFSCAKAFNTFRRKHHCRICGQIFCGNCTSLVDGARFNHEGKMRVCKNCYEHSDNYNNSSEESSIEDTDIPLEARRRENSTTSTGMAGDVFLLNDDEVQSILTTDDARRFKSTPTPPPKMAIPATRQGASLEISVPSSFPASSRNTNTGYALRTKDRATLKNIETMSPMNREHSSRVDHHSPKRAPSYSKLAQKISLKKSISGYMGNGSSGEAHHTRHSSNSVIANLSNSDFKFEFNYSANNSNSSQNVNRDSQNQLGDRSESTPMISLSEEKIKDDHRRGSEGEGSEDEGSMSLYATLNDFHHHDQNQIRSLRSSTKSLQRAQASLQRMKSHRRGKSRSNTLTNSVVSEFGLFNRSAPNLLSVVSNENDFPKSNESALVVKHKPRTDGFSSRDIKRAVSSFSAFRSDVPISKSELNEVSALHLEALLRQVLNDQDVEKSDEWMVILRPILKELQFIHLDANKAPTMDFKQNYVKIKRICGASITDSEFVNGVVYSKTIPYKSMPRFLKNPRILLIMFPLEYQKNGTHFMSLEAVMAQEKEFLNKLILRLTSFNPDLVLVGANVSGYALKLLDEAGIVVQFNLKPQVIERISKLTEADIAISIEKLATGIKVGTCEKFEVRTFIYENISKSYTFLEGCKRALGGTIVLRGSTTETMRKIKDVVEFLVYAVFALKLESSFFNDNFLHLSKEYYLEIQKRRLESNAAGYFKEFVDKFNNRILSVSPTVIFPLPFLLERARNLETELLIKEKEGKLTESKSDDDWEQKSSSLQCLNLKSALTQQDLGYLAKFIHERELEDLSDRFKWRKRHWELSYAASHNMLGTGTHQIIHVLYSMISTKTATPCIGPQLVSIDYFWDTDISIGQYIKNIVATASYPCQHGCGSLLIDHYRSYVHGTGKVDVLIEKLQGRHPALRNLLLTWSYCKRCGTSTPILQMSEKTWNFSFGKYLELLFWSSEKCTNGIGNCSHDFAKDHVKYFGYNDLMVRMEYSKIDVHELIPPRMKVTWKPSIDIKLKVELYYSILDKINNFYASVSDRLERVKLDTKPDEIAVSGKERISELKQRAEKEKNRLLNQTEEIYRNLPGDQHLGLNAVIRSLHDDAAGWDTEFIDFEKSFLPTEKDIARITATQLKKLFNDSAKADDFESVKSSLKSQSRADRDLKNGDEVDNEREEHESTSRKKSRSQPGGDSNDATQSLTQSSIRPRMSHHFTTPNLGEQKHLTTTNLSVDDSFVDGRRSDTFRHINSNEVLGKSSTRPASFSKDSLACDYRKRLSGSPSEVDYRRLSDSSGMSVPTAGSRDRNRHTKVGQLATFFDQMHFDALSKEFELQRELERMQLNKDKYKALRVESSRPIVEIYKNAKDAVDEPLHVDTKAKSTKNGGSKFGLGRSLVRDGVNLGSIAYLNSNYELETELENSIHQWGRRILDEATSKENDLTEDAPASGSRKSEQPLPPIITTTTANKDTSGFDTQSEKSSLMKILTNFWADRAATLWKPLHYPTTSTEHIFVDSLVIIREDELSSLIAFCLSSTDYLQKMKKLRSRDTCNAREPDAQGSNPLKFENLEGTGKANSTHRVASTSSVCSSEDMEEKAEETAVDATQSAPDIKESKSEDLETRMTKKTALHLRYQFQDGNTVMSCKIFFAEQFEAFRSVCGCERNFIQSLSRCIKWDSSGGKSGSAFLKTLDDRFVIKELSHTELDSFIKFAPSYFEYMAQAMFHDLPTALAKVFGFYQIQIKNSETTKSFKLDLIIMENLFYEKKMTRIFDLKGSMRNRHVEQTGKENEVLLDENMVEYIFESPIFVREYDKKLLRASLWNDTLFLAKINVMDYSLVVGVDNENLNLIVGIIDFIRTFTWDKKLESWVKERGFVGGGTKEPTVVTPRQYKNRFREAMDRYILMVPDPWYQEAYPN
ncbi:LAMI_0A06216g1_1 [Lachancea mirantina]|uniref:1-phosphatidylinositol-3-phosphate 5-kinase n=1 Tax=Lachancea mirantina TaxID=1230905 RepID=A0A1G4IQ75_9SACH|nr:LAMI_0A06216g1_1 [Lachancea mirantina]